MQTRPRDPAAVRWRTVLAIGFPILFAEIGETLVYLTDTLFMAQVGTAELAALALVDAVLELAIVPVLGVTEAVQIFIGRRVGEGREATVGPLFVRGMALVAVAAIVLAGLVAIGAGPVGHELIGSPAVADRVEDFLVPASPGIALFALNLGFSSLFVGLGRTRPLVAGTVVLVVTNVAVSAVLVFGHLGAPRLGIQGAAIGFVVAELAALVYFGLYTVRRVRPALAGSFGPAAPGVPSVRELLRLGGPVALQALIEALRWLGFFLIIERVSEEALAWSTVVYAAYTVLLIPSQAFAETTYTMVSRLIGEGHVERIGHIAWRAIASAYLATAPLLLLAAIFPATAVELLTAEPSTVAGVEDPLRIAAIAMLVVIPADIWLGAVIGTGDTDAGVVIELVVSAGVLVGCYVTAETLDADLAYVWLAVPVASLVGLVLSWAWVASGRWSRRAL